MIIHKLVASHLRRSDSAEFYWLQAINACEWIARNGGIKPGMRVLDLGAGSGMLGSRFERMGCSVTYADETNHLDECLDHSRFVQFKIGRDDLRALGEFDLVLFSNVLEHIADPRGFIGSVSKILRPGGLLYLSWTNWLSPWGGHDFSPFHYLGPRLGLWVHGRLLRRRTIFTIGKDLFQTHIGRTLSWIGMRKELSVVALAPRYYTELSWLARIPVLREFLCWNVAALIRRTT
jgi:SAM-dependent methyltransferase